MEQRMEQQQRDLQAFMADDHQQATSAPGLFHWQDVPGRPCSRLEKIANGSNGYCEAREVASNRKAVGDLIASGHCDDAIKGALGTGDLHFATEVRAFCEGGK